MSLEVRWETVKSELQELQAQFAVKYTASNPGIPPAGFRRNFEILAATSLEPAPRFCRDSPETDASCPQGSKTRQFWMFHFL
jgi:hypothetical protein